MPVTLSTEQLLELIKKSNLVELERLNTYIEKRGKASSSAEKMAHDMIAEGLITNFQKDQLLNGKWRGYTIGKYKVLERLGAGGMGSVYLCEHLKMKHKVAIKVLPTAKNNDPAALGRFEREARAAALLDHPNLVRAHDFDQDGELHYLVLDYVEGVNLQHLVSRCTGPLPVLRACHYICQAAFGLQYAFEQKLVHRDIKPANLLLDRAGVIRVLDLGLARFFEDSQDLLTLKYDDNNVLGTADYVSPEQAMDSHDVDIRTDVYSLGATFYFLLTGQALFPEGRVAQKLIWHKDRQPTPIRQLRPEVPAELEAIADKMLAKEPEARYQTPAEVIAALEPWVQTPIEPPGEDEIPLLCPAARGGSSDGGSGGRTPSPRPRDHGRVMPGNSSQRHAIPAKAATLTAPAASALHETPRALAGDSSTTQLQDELEATPAPASLPVKAAPRAASRISRILWLVLILGLGASGGFFLRLSLQGRPVPNLAPADKGRILAVDRSGRGNTYGSILEALQGARAGDTIQVCEDSWEEVLRIDSGGPLGRGVTVAGQGRDGNPTVWQPPAGHTENTSLIHLSAMPGLRLRNFILDGKDQLPHLVTIAGPCKGLVLEDIELRGFRTAGVRLTSAAGEADAPVLLQRVHAAPKKEAEAGIVLDSLPDQPSKHICVRDCRLEGPCFIGVAVNGPAEELRVLRCQLTGLADGILYHKGAAPAAVQLTLAGNTFRDLSRAGLRFEAPPLAEGSRVQLTENRFERVAVLSVMAGFKPAPLRTPAVWIWSSEPASKLYLRKRFTLETAPARAVLNLTADESYTVWLNGQRVGQGAFSETARQVQSFDVARFLHEGENAIAVEAGGKTAAAGVLAQLDDNATGIFTRTFVSDETWRTAPAAEPGWQQLAFNDTNWTPARAAASVRQHLVWDSVVQEQFKYQAQRVFPPPSGNERDAGSPEGFPRFDAALKTDKR